MFSGLTNQMSSWIGNTGKKQDGEIQKTEEEQRLSSPVVEDSVSGADAENKKDTSPTKSSRLDMLGNLGSVKTQMSSWLGSGIPGLRKGETAPAEPAEGHENPAQDVESPASEKSVKGSPIEKDDDDSSATGGADSDGHGSEASGSPVEDKDGAQAFGAVSTKALQGAKSIGSFLFSAVNKAGKTVSEAGAKIKKTVEENSLLGEFNKEQEAFIKDKQGKTGDNAAVPPWVGWPNEENLKEECLALSTDRRNFVRSPPAGVDFQFDFNVSYPVAMATLAEDPNLEKMRFDLVPKVITEENFWRNYFYRVSLICQASELNSMAQEGGGTLETRTSSVEGEPAAKPQVQSSTEAQYSSSDSPLHEFVSDTFRATSQDIEEVREGMKKLGLDPTPVKEEEWEKELEADLQDYEVVADGDRKSDAHWENQIEEMLDADDPTDLK